MNICSPNLHEQGNVKNYFIQIVVDMENSNKKFTGKIAVALIEKNSKILIAQRAKKDVFEGLWEFPGGKQEEGETVQQCLKRELYEEFGIRAIIGEYVCNSFFELNGKLNELLAFKVTSFSGNLQCKEHKKIKWILPNFLEKYNFANPALLLLLRKKQGHFSINLD